MNLKDAVLRPFEYLAGQEYPDMHGVRREASESGASMSEIEMSVSAARRDFMIELVHLRGLQGHEEAIK